MDNTKDINEFNIMLEAQTPIQNVVPKWASSSNAVVSNLTPTQIETGFQVGQIIDAGTVNAAINQLYKYFENHKSLSRAFTESRTLSIPVSTMTPDTNVINSKNIISNSDMVYQASEFASCPSTVNFKGITYYEAVMEFIITCKSSGTPLFKVIGNAESSWNANVNAKYDVKITCIYKNNNLDTYTIEMKEYGVNDWSNNIPMCATMGTYSNTSILVNDNSVNERRFGFNIETLKYGNNSFMDNYYIEFLSVDSLFNIPTTSSGTTAYKQGSIDRWRLGDGCGTDTKGVGELKYFTGNVAEGYYPLASLLVLEIGLQCGNFNSVVSPSAFYNSNWTSTLPNEFNVSNPFNPSLDPKNSVFNLLINNLKNNFTPELFPFHNYTNLGPIYSMGWQSTGNPENPSIALGTIDIGATLTNSGYKTFNISGNNRNGYYTKGNVTPGSIRYKKDSWNISHSWTGVGSNGQGFKDGGAGFPASTGESFNFSYYVDNAGDTGGSYSNASCSNTYMHNNLSDFESSPCVIGSLALKIF